MYLDTTWGTDADVWAALASPGPGQSTLEAPRLYWLWTPAHGMFRCHARIPEE